MPSIPVVLLALLFPSEWEPQTATRADLDAIFETLPSGVYDAEVFAFEENPSPEYQTLLEKYYEAWGTPEYVAAAKEYGESIPPYADWMTLSKAEHRRLKSFSEYVYGPKRELKIECVKTGDSQLIFSGSGWEFGTIAIHLDHLHASYEGEAMSSLPIAEKSLPGCPFGEFEGFAFNDRVYLSDPDSDKWTEVFVGFTCYPFLESNGSRSAIIEVSIAGLDEDPSGTSSASTPSKFVARLSRARLTTDKADSQSRVDVAHVAPTTSELETTLSAVRPGLYQAYDMRPARYDPLGKLREKFANAISLRVDEWALAKFDALPGEIPKYHDWYEITEDEYISIMTTTPPHERADESMSFRVRRSNGRIQVKPKQARRGMATFEIDLTRHSAFVRGATTTEIPVVAKKDALRRPNPGIQWTLSGEVPIDPTGGSDSGRVDATAILSINRIDNTQDSFFIYYREDIQSRSSGSSQRSPNARHFVMEMDRVGD